MSTNPSPEKYAPKTLFPAGTLLGAAFAPSDSVDVSTADDVVIYVDYVNNAGANTANLYVEISPDNGVWYPYLLTDGTITVDAQGRFHTSSREWVQDYKITGGYPLPLPVNAVAFLRVQVREVGGGAAGTITVAVSQQ